MPLKEIKSHMYAWDEGRISQLLKENLAALDARIEELNLQRRH